MLDVVDKVGDAGGSISPAAIAAANRASAHVRQARPRFPSRRHSTIAFANASSFCCCWSADEIDNKPSSSSPRVEDASPHPKLSPSSSASSLLWLHILSSSSIPITPAMNPTINERIARLLPLAVKSSGTSSTAMAAVTRPAARCCIAASTTGDSAVAVPC